MEKQLFRSTLYVAVSRADGSEPFVQVMFHSDRKSDFRRKGISFSRLNATLTICGAGGPRDCKSLAAYGDVVEVANALGERFRVAAFATEPRANAFLSTGCLPDMSATP